MSPISWKRFSKGTKGIANIFFSEIIDLSESKLCINIHWIKPLSILHFFCHSEIQLDSTTEPYGTINVNYSYRKPLNNLRVKAG
jgi:hypothetical protein